MKKKLFFTLTNCLLILLIFNGCGNSFHKRKYTAGKFKHPKDHKKASSHHRKNKKWVAENKKQKTNTKKELNNSTSAHSETNPHKKTTSKPTSETITHKTQNHSEDYIDVKESEISDNNQQEKESSQKTKIKKNKSEKKWKTRSIDDNTWNIWTVIFWSMGPFITAAIVLFFIGAAATSIIGLILSLVFGIIALVLISLSLYFTQSILYNAGSLKNKFGKEILQIFMWFLGVLAVIALIIFIIFALVVLF